MKTQSIKYLPFFNEESEYNDILSITSADDFIHYNDRKKTKKTTKPKYNKVVRDPEFDAIADNDFLTVIGDFGLMNTQIQE